MITAACPQMNGGQGSEPQLPHQHGGRCLLFDLSGQAGWCFSNPASRKKNLREFLSPSKSTYIAQIIESDQDYINLRRASCVTDLHGEDVQVLLNTLPMSLIHRHLLPYARAQSAMS